MSRAAGFLPICWSLTRAGDAVVSTSEQSAPLGWRMTGQAGCYEHGSGRWRIEPCWTGRGVELFKRTSEPKNPWTVVLVFDDVDAAARYVEQR